jgi:hypothetical protein
VDLWKTVQAAVLGIYANGRVQGKKSDNSLCHNILYHSKLFCFQITRSNYYSIKRAETRLGYSPVVNDRQMTEILRSFGLSRPLLSHRPSLMRRMRSKIAIVVASQSKNAIQALLLLAGIFIAVMWSADAAWEN